MMNRYLVHVWCGKIHAATYVNAFFPTHATLEARGALRYAGEWRIQGRPENHGDDYFIYLIHRDVRACLFIPVLTSQEAVAEAERVLDPGHLWEARGLPSEQGPERSLKDEWQYYRGFRRTPHDWGPYNRLLVNAQNG